MMFGKQGSALRGFVPLLGMICSLTGNILFPYWECFPNRQGKRQPSLSPNIIDFVQGLISTGVLPLMV